MKRSFALAIVVGVMASALALPMTAMAFGITGGGGTQTQNPYGLWYAGQEACAREGCHAAIAAKPSPHSEMVKDVAAYPSALVPAAGSTHWPYLSSFGGITIRPRDVYLQVGDTQAGLLEYIGFGTSALSTGIKPADDLPLWDPMEWLIGESEWLAPEAKIGNRTYVQSCSACHNLGTTRPSNATFTLANGALQTTATPSTVSALSIQCEVCHGTGKNPNGHKTGVPSVVGGNQLLKAQLCGQCHVSGTAPQKNVAGGSFTTPNGFTADATLTAFFTPYTTVESETTFINWLANGGTKPKFLPNGANYSMRHSYYNEWLINKAPSGYGGEHGHADPLNNAVKKYGAAGTTKCLRCHSGRGFLYRIGAKTPSGTRIVPTYPTISEATTGDPGISCQVCHSGHVGMGDNGAYDSLRKWGNGREVSCGDCHNWQFETLDQPLQYETIDGVEHARPAANSFSRHPQREVFTGGRGGEEGTGGMWGVKPMAATMPGVECQDCHMPRTHKEGMPADDDGTNEATRMSHRFHIVEPGDAARYRLRPNGDSCAPSCHEEDASEYSRADMQAWLDQRQTAVAGASAAATGALGAVASDLGLANWNKFIAAQPTTGAAGALSAARWTMLQRSAQNADIVINDASSGAHNPAYALAGLAKAKLWAQSVNVTLDASLGSGLALGDGMLASGTLRGFGGAPITDAEVVLETSTDGHTWTYVSAGKSNGSGAFSLPTGRIVGTRSFRLRFTPMAGIDYVSSLMPVAVPVTTAGVTPASATSAWLGIGNAQLTLRVTPGARTYYRLSGATVRAATLYSGAVAINREGRTDMTFWSANSNGAEAAQKRSVYIDRANPAINSDIRRVFANKAVVHVWGSDAGAGIGSMRYTFRTATRAVTASSFTFNTMALGKNSLVVKATDRAGKTTSKTLSVWVKATPKLSMSPTRTKRISARRSVKFATRVTRGKDSAGHDIMLTNRPLILQRWDGRKWVSWKKFSTRSGARSWTRKFTSKGTSYWRWRVTPDNYSYPANSPVLKVVVK